MINAINETKNSWQQDNHFRPIRETKVNKVENIHHRQDSGSWAPWAMLVCM